MTSMRPVEELSYEEALNELQAVVEALERGDQPLEEAVRLYERGQQLLARCARLLEQARLRLRLLDEVPEIPADLQAYLASAEDADHDG